MDFHLRRKALGQAAPSRGQPAPRPAAPTIVQVASAPPPAQPPAPAPAPPAEGRVEVLAQRMSELSDRVLGLGGALDALRQETSAIGQRLKDSDEKFVRLLSLLESRHGADNPFLDARPSPLLEDVAAAPAAALAGHAPAAAAAVEAGELGAWSPRALRDPTPPGTPAPASASQGSLHASVLLLGWAEMLLQAVERESLGHLLDWYEKVGWVDASLKDMLMLYARGIYVPAEEPAAKPDAGKARRRGEPPEVPPWRQDVELHLRSLGFVARLTGRAADPGRLEEAVRQAVDIRAA